ncbi:innexin unc-9 [Aplysia californica]|uniref:Innexin n=1 Tax=Aplysia californica TaxID=6500 RepID=A0ABM0K5V4_APLCA|nr:innexin unc-9 [Aplysia californica]WEY19502.1 innexin 12 [Aplysia californica]
MSFSKVLTASAVVRVSDEDLCSQLNHVWTVSLLATLGFLITLVQYVGDPIQCWCPAQMPDAHCNYTKALCWVKENYYVNKDEYIQFKEEDRAENQIAYYPWVPWILFSMAFALKLPHVMWTSFLPSSGLNLGKLVDLADSHENIDNLAKIIRIWLVRTHRVQKNVLSRVKKILGSVGLFWMGKNSRTYLTGLTIGVKWAYLLVTIGLFFSLNLFIQEEFISYGFEVLDGFLRGIPRESVTFPKNTICDFKIRQLANIHTYSIQCVLPINMYNEYIFIFLWFWLVLLCVVNTYSLIKWNFYLLSPGQRREFVKGYAAIVFRLLQEAQKPPDVDTNGNSLSSAPANDATPILNGASPSGDNNGVPRERRRLRFDSIVSVTSSGGTDVRAAPPSQIEEDPKEARRRQDERQIDRITNRMIKHFGHDGVVVFRTLESGVGVIIANQIFQELYLQITHAMHYL